MKYVPLKINKIFWLFTVGIFIGLLIPTLVQDGMFLDGVTYSSVSKNLAHGIGSLWKLHYTKTLYPDFYEHPPLVFGIQSLFFKILGDGKYTERIFTFLTAVLTALGIVMCWRLFTNQNEFRNYSWLPVLLWISMPLVFWSYKNNLLENTLGVFTLFSIYFISLALINERIIWLIIGNIFIVMAFLSKGFPGLFPLVSVLIYWLAIKPKRKGVIFFYCLVTMILPFLVFYFINILFPGLIENFNSYLNQQLIPSLNEQREITTNNHFSILFKLFLELSLPLLLIAVLIIRNIFFKHNFQIHNKNIIVFFFLIGISASFPLIISLKQRAFYLIPSIPYFVIGISFLLISDLKNIFEALSVSILKWVTRISILVIVFTFAFSIFKFGKYSRDENKLKDVYLISKNIPSGTIIGTTKEIWNDWGFVAYMCRIGYLSLDCDNENNYYLIKRNDKVPANLIKNYTKIDLDLNLYVIYKKSWKK